MGFSEDEVKLQNELMQYIGKHFHKDMDITEAFKLVKLIQHGNSMLRRMHSMIAEVKQIVDEPSEPSDGDI